VDKSVNISLLDKYTSGYILNCVAMLCYFALTVIQIIITLLAGINLAHVLIVPLVIWGVLERVEVE